MPQAVAAAVVAAVGITGFAATIGTAVIAAAINVGVGLLVSALGSGRTKGNLTPNPVQLRDRTQQVRQPITARRVWLGEGRFSGPVIHLESTNSNKFLHIGIALATHEIAGLDTYYLDDDPIFADDLNASGLVTAGKYKNKVRIKPHLGTAAQVADADLVAESAVYTSSDRGRGVAWVYLRLEFDQKLFPSAVPNVSVVGRGSNQIADPRDASTGYSSNAVLLFNHYLTNWYDGGRGAAIPSAKVEESYTTAGANISDEVVSAKAVTHTVSAVSASDDALDLEGEVLEFFREDRVTIASTGSLPAGLPATGYVIPVRRESTSHKALRIQIAETMADARDGVAVDITDAGSGTITLTKTGEPRYRIDGGIDLDQPPATIMEDLLTAMGGVAPYIAGTWRIYPAAYRAPVEHFIDDEHLRSSLKVRSRTPRRDRFNAVKGLHVSPLAFDQPDEYPLVTVAAYETADGERIVTDLDLPYTARPNAAQRLARIHLERSRREIVAEGDFDIIAMRVVAGDTIKLTHAVYGWSEKVFEVFDFDWRLQERDGQPDMVCHLRLRETDANVYAFDTGDEVGKPPAARTNLPNFFDVSPPQSLAVGTAVSTTAAGDLVYSIVVSWAEAVNALVLNDGAYELRYKRSASGVWQPTARYDGSATRAVIAGVDYGVQYDIEVRAITYVGGQSNWEPIEGYTVGSSTAGVTEINDFGPVTETVTTTKDLGAVTDTVTETLDGGPVAA